MISYNYPKSMKLGMPRWVACIPSNIRNFVLNKILQFNIHQWFDFQVVEELHRSHLIPTDLQV